MYDNYCISHLIGPLLYYCKHICTCASVYSNFNIIYTQLCIKSVLLYSNVVYCKLIIHGEGIMSHSFPCSPQGGKISQLNPMHLLYRAKLYQVGYMHSCMQFIKRSTASYARVCIRYYKSRALQLNVH